MIQAQIRCKNNRSIVLCSGEKEVENRGGKLTLARTYFNVYTRTAYHGEPLKVIKILYILFRSALMRITAENCFAR